MKVLFVGAYYYERPIRHLYRIFEIYKAIGDVFETVGIEAFYFVKHNEVIPLHKTIDAKDINSQIESSDLVFIWNGRQCQHIIEKCRSLGIPIYFSELGWLPQNGTFYFDRKGVNYESSLLDWKYTEITPEQRQRLNIQLEYYQTILAKKTGIEEQGFVFVPFQVESDSQIILHSPRIKKMQELVDYVCAFVPGKIIFKAHPKQDPGDIRLPERCNLYCAGTTHDFLPVCDYVVTVNSTVGVEALSYYKPVINLGDAFYEGRLLTYKVSNDNQFKTAIEWAQQGKVAKGAIESFLYYLFQKQWYTQDLASRPKIFGLIEHLTDIDIEEGHLNE